jgi:hypothetical protein
MMRLRNTALHAILKASLQFMLMCNAYSFHKKISALKHLPPCGISYNAVCVHMCGQK